MCLQASLVKPWDSWNWVGDEIIHKPIIPASRTVPGTKKRYPIDIREFLTTTNNAVVSQALDNLIRTLPSVEQSLFRSHSRGSFDFRADTIKIFVGQLRYVRSANKEGRCPDAWLYPDETLAQGGGDCEDLAFLQAALLMAAGISGYCIRVALGALKITLPDGKAQQHDHVWVMYQNESSIWEILEPMPAITSGTRRAAARAMVPAVQSLEYVPFFVFNADHLWRIQSRHLDANCEFVDYCLKRTFWGKFDPSFAAGVHSTIYDKALGDLLSAGALSIIKRESLWLDANILIYDPRDHFDNGYIAESWARVKDRLTQFKQSNSDWKTFGAAAHSIGDFYAHSSYLHFAVLQNPADKNGQAPIYVPGIGLVASPCYTSASADPSLPAFDLTSNQFSTNTELWKGTKQQAADAWKGKLISGRYAQLHDPWAGFFEGLTGMPVELSQAPGYAVRGSLPRHDEIAVDDTSMGKQHRLYAAKSSGPADRGAYANQFRWRVNTAIQHVRQAFLDNRPAGP
jgi:hypothetical protein